jgi:hypothetical protein
MTEQQIPLTSGPAAAPAGPGARVGAYLVDFCIVAGLGLATLPLANSWPIVAVVCFEGVVVITLARAATGRTPGSLLARMVGFAAGSDRAPGLGRQSLRTAVQAALQLTVLGPLISAASTKYGQDWADRVAGTAAATLVGSTRPSDVGQATTADTEASWTTPVHESAVPRPQVAAPHPREQTPITGYREPQAQPSQVVSQPSSQSDAPRQPMSAHDFVPSPVSTPVPSPTPHQAANPSSGAAAYRTPHPAPADPAVGTDSVTPAPRRLVAADQPAAARPAPAVQPSPAQSTGGTAPSVRSLRAWAIFDSGHQIELSQTLVLGREPVARDASEQAIPIADPSMSLSRTHLRLGVDETGVWIEDAFSTNGTGYLSPDGRAVMLPQGERVNVTNGTVVLFGDYRLTLAQLPAAT